MRSSLYSLPRHLSLRPHLHRGRNDQLHRERTSQFRKNANGDYMIVLFNDEIIKICFPRSLTLFVKCDSSSRLHTRLIRYRRLRSIYWTPAEDFLMMNSTSGLWWSSQGEDELFWILQLEHFFFLRSSRLSVSYPSTSTSALSSFSNQKTGDKWRSSLLPQLSSHSHSSL